MILYRVFYWIARLFFPLLLDVRIRGGENIPRTGPVLVVSNHLSYTDPVVLGIACRRPVHYLGKSDLFRHNRLFARLITSLGCVPIRRDGHASSTIRKAAELLAAGKVVGMFPEGGIRARGGLKAGVALIAARTEGPIVPVHLSGTRGMYDPEAYLLRARKVRVEVGRPFYARDLADPSKRAHFTDRLLAEISSRIVRGHDAVERRPARHPAGP